MNNEEDPIPFEQEFPEAASELATLLRTNARVAEGNRLMFREETGEFVSKTYRNPSKIGRNDPCPCGSGRKYKRCCMLG